MKAVEGQRRKLLVAAFGSYGLLRAATGRRWTAAASRSCQRAVTGLTRSTSTLPASEGGPPRWMGGAGCGANLSGAARPAWHENSPEAEVLQYRPFRRMFPPAGAGRMLADTWYLVIPGRVS
ncbi:hypothetical protein VSR68_28845 [Paraburkholderia phymatum]|uniref:hypothetical protein n=1 Tax=Paraburkholderia phymatum TaxID=148447 RepID=UPI00317513B6